MSDRVLIGQFEVQVADLDAALSDVEALVNDGGCHYVCFCEGNLLAHSLENEELCNVFRKSDLVYPDGIAVMWLGRMAGASRMQRVPGPNFMLAACAHGVLRGWRHFFYGSKVDTLQLLTTNLRERFPGIQIAGSFSPPFRALTIAEELTVKKTIESVSPHFLWVGLGGPKQEFWMAEHVGKIRVPIMLGVGAAFDFYAGTRPWAPVWVQRAGLTWLFRMATGGRRTMLRNCRCLPSVSYYLLKQWAKSLLK